MSNASSSKAEWLDRIDRAEQMWEELVALASDAGMDQPGATGEWTFKDVAAHLNAWRDLTVARLEAAAGDKAPPRMPWPDGMDEETDEGTQEINRWFYARDRARPTGEVLSLAGDQFRRIRSAVESIPEGELATEYPWLEGYPISAVIDGFLEHLHVDHEPDIRAWLANRSG